jgi:hypothetical protein
MDDDIGLNASTVSFTWNGADVTSSFAYNSHPLDGGPNQRNYSGSLTLRQGVNTLYAHVCDVDGACDTEAWTWGYDGAPPLVSLSGGGYTNNASAPLTINWCDDVGLNDGSRSIRVVNPNQPRDQIVTSRSVTPRRACRDAAPPRSRPAR